MATDAITSMLYMLRCVYLHPALPLGPRHETLPDSGAGRYHRNKTMQRVTSICIADVHTGLPKQRRKNTEQI
jgi:hypothetical protein